MVGKPQTLKGRAATCCEFRGDGKHLAVGSKDGCVFVFKVGTPPMRIPRIPPCDHLMDPLD